RLYITHFSPQRAGGFALSAQLGIPWPELLAQLGLDQATAGERAETRDAPTLAGTVARVGDNSVALLLDAPARGLAYLGSGGPGMEVLFFVRAKLFGENARELAAREEAAWERWLARVGAAA